MQSDDGRTDPGVRRHHRGARPLHRGDTVVQRKTAERPRLGSILRKRETWLIALAFTGPLSLYLALNTWLPSHYMQAFGLTKADAARLTGLFNLVGIPTAILGGWLTARLGLRRPLIMAAGLAMPPAALALCFAPDPAVRVISAILLGMSFFLYVSPLFTIPMELPGMTSPGVAMLNGVVFSLAYLVSFASPVLVGALGDRLGSYGPGLAAFALGSASLALAGWLLPETGKERLA
jgi:cyanate permease